MTTKKIHFVSGLTITLFIALHLFNHAVSIFGADKHIEMMNSLRVFYRNIFVETILMVAVFVQIFSGIKLLKNHWKSASSNFQKLEIWSGLYLAFFLVIHVSVVVIGRFYLKLDTNFYFGVAGLNSFPLNLFFIPYYGLAIISFFAHIACVHNKKMEITILKMIAKSQSKLILLIGICLTFVILFGLTNRFQGVKIPAEYNVLVGK